MKSQHVSLLALSLAILPLAAWADFNGGHSAPGGGHVSAPPPPPPAHFSAPAHYETPHYQAPANYEAPSHYRSSGATSSWSSPRSAAGSFTGAWSGGTVRRSGGGTWSYAPPVTMVRQGQFIYNPAGLAAAQGQSVSLHIPNAVSNISPLNSGVLVGPQHLSYHHYWPAPGAYTGYYYSGYSYLGDTAYSGDATPDMGYDTADFAPDVDMTGVNPDSMRGDDMTGQDVPGPAPAARNQVYQVTGTVTAINDQQITIHAANGGYTFQLSGKTHTSEIVSLGDPVVVSFSVSGDGSYQAVEISRSKTQW